MAFTMLLADRILVIDAEAMVLDKPAGLPVTETRDGALSVANHLEFLRFGYQRLPSPVHRLDRDTSGCLLLSRNPRAHKRFSAAFEVGEVTKEYLAILDGVPDGADGIIDMALAKVSSAAAGWRMFPNPRGKSASTAWRLVAVREGRALVAFTPKTGRTHQLRVHAASGLGVPIAGDPVYGLGGGSGTLLHAWKLSVPRAGKAPVAAEAPLPPAFADFADAFT